MSNMVITVTNVNRNKTAGNSFLYMSFGDVLVNDGTWGGVTTVGGGEGLSAGFIVWSSGRGFSWIFYKQSEEFREYNVTVTTTKYLVNIKNCVLQ